MFFILIPAILFFVIVLVQIYLLKYRTIKPIQELSSRREGIPDSNLSLISVIICAKNEAENLRKNIPFILSQDYPTDRWELIVVNDASTDDTFSVLNEFQADFPLLKIINIQQDTRRHLPGKKQALHKGILSANFPTVLLTDADCRPAGSQWIKCMAKALALQNKEIILGYGAYSRGKGLLNKMIQWETLQSCMQYMGMAASGKPYMGVGRNLIYQKKMYLNALENPDFLKTYSHVLSGDDDLLLAYICNKDNTGICLQPESYTISTPETTLRSWLHQKSRHFSTGKFYPQNIKAILGLSALTQGSFWLLWLLLIIILIFRSGSFETSLLAGIFASGLLRLGLYWHNARKWYDMLRNGQLWIFYPFGEIGQSVLQLILSPYIFRKNKKQWKS